MCFRLYTKTHFEQDMPTITLPEIQRTALANAVLYLKSLHMHIDVLAFDFLDRPETAALEDALRQLYVLDAIDASGDITAMGKQMSLLPLDPTIARSLIAARDLGVLPEMITVAAMLSAEHIFQSGHPHEGGREGRQQGEREHSGRGKEASQQEMKKLLSEGLGDHVLLLRLWQLWQRNHFHRDFCKSYGLDLRGMNFARDIRKQLEGIVGEDGRGLEQANDSRETGSPHSKRRRCDDNEPHAQQPHKGERTQRDERQRNGRERDRGGREHQRDGRERPRDERRQEQDERERPRDARERDRGGREHPTDEKERQRDERGRCTDAVDGADQAAGTSSLPLLLPSSRGRKRPKRPASDAAVLDALRQALTTGFATRIAHRMRSHNGYRTMNVASQLAQLHPSSSHLAVDEDGLLPEWIIYHEFVSTSRPFLRQVCVSRADWVEPLLPRLHEVNVRALSRGSKHGAGGAAADAPITEADLAPVGQAPAVPVTAPARRNDDAAVSAARERFLARKRGQGK